MAGELRTAIEAAGPGLWAAPHLSGEVPADVSFLDVVPLSTGSLAVWAAGEDFLVTPVVREGSGVRRAVPGDGVFCAVAAAMDASPVAAGRVERGVGSTRRTSR